MTMQLIKKLNYFLRVATMCIIFCGIAVAMPKQKIIALTFDDGPSEKYTPRVLDILKKNNAKATFFVVGYNIKKHPELVKRVVDEGSVIGNHSYTHPNFSKLSDAAAENELKKTNELIYKAIHVYPILFRPPFGVCSGKTKEIVTRLGFKKVTWDFLINDYDVNKMTSDIIATSIIKHAGPGAIMAMHDGGGNREKTVEALPRIIATLKSEGYRFVTVDEILGIKPYRTQ